VQKLVSSLVPFVAGALRTMKSSLRSDEIFGEPPQMISSLRSGKSASPIPTKSDFIAKRFHPPKVDFFRQRRI
jgi:hypothetical protein